MNYRVDEGSNETLHNWITSLDLLCTSNFKLGLFGSLYFVGFVVGAITLLRLGDIYGRRPVLLFTSSSYLLLYILLFFANDLNLIYCLIVVGGWLAIARGALFYIYMLEMVPAGNRKKYHTLLMSTEAIIGMMTAGLFFLISNAKVSFIIMFVFTAFHINFVIRAPESPKFLHSKGDLQKTHESLKYISKANNCGPYRLQFFDENVVETPQEASEARLSQLEMVNTTFIPNLCIMAFNWAVCSLSFYIIGYYIGKFPGNLFMNGFLMALADFFSSLASGKYIDTAGISLGFTYAYSALIMIIVAYSFLSGYVLAGYLCVFLMRF